jgi:hypothetical protein
MTFLVFSVSTRLTSGEHRLVLTILEQRAVRCVGNGEHVRCNLITTAALVDIDHLLDRAVSQPHTVKSGFPVITSVNSVQFSIFLTFRVFASSSAPIVLSS